MPTASRTEGLLERNFRSLIRFVCGHYFVQFVDFAMLLRLLRFVFRLSIVISCHFH